MSRDMFGNNLKVTDSFGAPRKPTPDKPASTTHRHDPDRCTWKAGEWNCDDDQTRPGATVERMRDGSEIQNPASTLTYDREQEERDSYNYRNEQEAERFDAPARDQARERQLAAMYQAGYATPPASTTGTAEPMTKDEQVIWDRGYRYGLADAQPTPHPSHEALVEAVRAVDDACRSGDWGEAIDKSRAALALATKE